MNQLIKIENTDIMSIYQKSENILSDIQNIIETSQRQAYHAVDTILSQRNWLIGYRIAEEEIESSGRAEYGANIIKNCSKIVDTACRQSHIRLSWSHYRAHCKKFVEEQKIH